MVPWIIRNQMVCNLESVGGHETRSSKGTFRRESLRSSLRRLLWDCSMGNLAFYLKTEHIYFCRCIIYILLNPEWAMVYCYIVLWRFVLFTWIHCFHFLPFVMLTQLTGRQRRMDHIQWALKIIKCLQVPWNMIVSLPEWQHVLANRV